jgi:hypothetical protein
MYYGTIVFQLINIGSKSEGLHPFLYRGKGDFLKVWREDDYSFEGDSLMPYDGKNVIIEGTLDEDIGIFIIENIRENTLENSVADNLIEISSPKEECVTPCEEKCIPLGEESVTPCIEKCRSTCEEIAPADTCAPDIAKTCSECALQDRESTEE